MIINMCDYPIRKARELVKNFGGEITRYNDGVCDICFINFSMEIHDAYVILRNPNNLNNNSRVVINNMDFSTIYVH